MVMQVRRTLSVGATPTGLAEGQISVGMADQPPIAWVGVPTSVNPSGVIPITGLVRTVAGAPQPAGALGQLWWDEDAAQLFVYTGNQWVVAVNPPIPDLSAFATQQWVLDHIPDAPEDTSIVPVGGRLSIAGTSPSGSVVYAPFQGGWLRIGGADYPIPAAGIVGQLGNAVIDGAAGQTLSDDTLYFVYAFNSGGGVLALEFSTTGHATSVTAGNVSTQIKTGDDSRTLVGMVHPLGGAFHDAINNRCVRSWLNRVRSAFYARQQPITYGTTWQQMPTTQCRTLAFADDSAFVTVNGSAQNTVVSLTPNIGIYWNGGLSLFQTSFFINVSQWNSSAISGAFQMTDGIHSFVMGTSCDVNDANTGVGTLSGIC